jgi:hypothetical protein
MTNRKASGILVRCAKIKQKLFVALAICVLAACDDQAQYSANSNQENLTVNDEPYIPSDTPTGIEIEKIFAGQEDERGDVDVKGVIEALSRLLNVATRDDLPELLKAIKSPRCSFWSRELFAEPIAKVGGLDCLPELFAALHQNADEGHDNDRFNAILIDLVEADPANAKAKLEEVKSASNKRNSETAGWLIQFCD